MRIKFNKYEHELKIQLCVTQNITNSNSKCNGELNFTTKIKRVFLKHFPVVVTHQINKIPLIVLHKTGKDRQKCSENDRGTIR